MNYHEMTMTESRDSPQRRLQFQVICAIMASCFVYSVYISGILLTIEAFETPLPGGNFCYKQITRDYVASMGIGRRLRKEILEAFPKEDETEGISVKDRRKLIEDKVYHVYLDNPEDVGGAHTRWMSGVLATDEVEKLSYCDPLFEKNPEIRRQKKLQSEEPDNEKKASELFEQAAYQSVDWPVVDSLAIRFPFSDGFTSALVFSYKIIPELRKLAAEKGEPGNNPVIISQCSVGEKECTHYIPLSKGHVFHGGLPSTEEHQKGTEAAGFSLALVLKRGLRVIFPFMKSYIGTTENKPADSDNFEL